MRLQLLCRRWEADTQGIPSTGAIQWVPSDVQRGFPFQRIVDNVIHEEHIAAQRAAAEPEREDEQQYEQTEGDSDDDDDLYDEEEDENDALVAMAEDLGDWEASRYHDLLSST